MKTCTGCKQIKPPSEFFRDSRRDGGLLARCKTCKAPFDARQKQTGEPA